jgi:hypothetical protein
VCSRADREVVDRCRLGHVEGLVHDERPVEGEHLVAGAQRAGIDEFARGSGEAVQEVGCSWDWHRPRAYPLGPPGTSGASSATIEGVMNDRTTSVSNSKPIRTHVQQHIATMVRLDREDRYNRSTHDVEDITGHPAQSVRQYVDQHRDLFS